MHGALKRRVGLLAVLLVLGSPGLALAQSDAEPGMRKLDLSLDARPFLPARPGADEPVGARPAAPAASTLAGGNRVAPPLPRGARSLQPTRTDDDFKLRFNVKGYSLLEVDDGAATRFSFRRIRERELRDPAVSLTLQKKF